MNYPCNVCGQEAIACLRPDMDIKGLCFCEAHRDQVYAVYTLLLMDDGLETAKEIMQDWKSK